MSVISPAFVLVRPQLGENIGAVARAMLNFGLTDLRLVAPRDGWPNPAAGPAASGADEVLADARVFATVPEAVSDCADVYAATVRRRDLILPVVDPAAAAKAMRQAPGQAAILLGAERSGLETAEAAHANAILTIPINPAFGSLNLAQAAVIIAYEWARGAPLAVPTRRDEEEPRASAAELEGFILQLDGELEAVDYFFPPDRAPATRATLRTIFSKPGWSSREVRALRGVLRALTHPYSRNGQAIAKGGEID